MKAKKDQRMCLQGQTDMVEPWYSTEYSEERIPESWLSSWREAALPPELHLPLPNPFISSDFALIQVTWLSSPLIATSTLVLLCVPCLMHALTKCKYVRQCPSITFTRLNKRWVRLERALLL